MRAKPLSYPYYPQAKKKKTKTKNEKRKTPKKPSHNKTNQQKLHSCLSIVATCIYSPRCPQAAEAERLKPEKTLSCDKANLNFSR